MLKNVDFLAHIVCDGISSYYFYYKPDKYLLPIEIPSVSKGACSATIDTVDTLKRVINGLSATIKEIKIYLYQDQQYYTYMTLEKDGKEFDINAGFPDAVELAISFNCGILVESGILELNGFKITKDLIENALLCD